MSKEHQPIANGQIGEGERRGSKEALFKAWLQSWVEGQEEFKSIKEAKYLMPLLTQLAEHTPWNASHSARVWLGTSRLLARDHADTEAFSDKEKQDTQEAALGHDFGKMAVRKEVLEKEGPLTKDEALHLQIHPRKSFDLINPHNFAAAAIAVAHHECQGPRSYPRKSEEEAKPNERIVYHYNKQRKEVTSTELRQKRIVSLFDVIDSLFNKRPYPKWITNENGEQVVSSSNEPWTFDETEKVVQTQFGNVFSKDFITQAVSIGQRVTNEMKEAQREILLV